MRVLFVHRNYPAHFGHIAAHLTRELGWKCLFVSEHADREPVGVTRVAYSPQGGATEQSHYFSRTLENAIAHAAGVHEACATLSAELHPDLIVGHSGFGTTLFPPELFPGVPIVNLFEYFYRPHGSNLDFRPDFPPLPEHTLRSRARNAMIMLDLEQCTLGYAPTVFQRDLFPREYATKLEVVHDGLDTSFWQRVADVEPIRERLGLKPTDHVITYCSRGLESMRGFDVFMRAARRVYEADKDARFVVVGSNSVSYGGALRFTGGRSFREHVLAEHDYDLTRFRFLGRVEPSELVQIFSVSDLHVYLTVPFVLSWSMLNAMACGCTVVGSDTAPVRELIEHDVNGALCDFFDAAALAHSMREPLARSERRAALGAAARGTITERYGLEATLPRMLGLYERAAAAA